MPSKKINADLQKERDKCSFKTEELTNLIDGSPAKTRERREREVMILSEPGLIEEEVPSEYLSHKEKYEEAIPKACVLFKLIRRQQQMESTGMENYREVLGGMLGSAILKDGSPLGLHYIMFIPTLMGQGNVEQQAEWIGKAWNCSIIGTYAQTELGHGTFIRGLETTATYDPNTKEFILNSPTLTSYKWWPGGLGNTANYCVVVAQLYTQGKCHGIHPFIVQLRDEETHMPLPGIKIGEIGAKLGMNTVNQGFLGFNQYRIPREHMLMKNSQVLEDGTYVSSPSSKLTYGTMMFVRVVIVNDMSTYLSKAATIAVRYSAVRHQSQIDPNEPEPQVMEFVTQQHKLFPTIAQAHAFRVTASWLWDMYNNVTAELDAGDLERLPELHALACCLKAVCTADAAAAVERCRLACGGHGYMMSSNLPVTYGLVTAANTYEGENTVLLLQTARFLVKAYNQALSGQAMTPTVSYLVHAIDRRATPIWESSVKGIIRGFELVAAGKIRRCAENIDRRVKLGLKHEHAWNETSILLTHAAEFEIGNDYLEGRKNQPFLFVFHKSWSVFVLLNEYGARIITRDLGPRMFMKGDVHLPSAHCRTILVSTFATETEKMLPKMSPELKTVMWQVVELYLVYTALEKCGDLLLYTSISQRDIEMLQSWYEQLLAKIRPNAVGLVDAFDIRDEVLSSALGAYDGQVYERLMEEAMKSPLNKEPVNASFHKYLKPFMKSNL